MFDLIVIVSFERKELFKGNFVQFEDHFFSFPDGCSIETKIKMIREWEVLEGFAITIEDKNGIQA